MIKPINLVLEQDEDATGKDKAVVSTMTDAITFAMQYFNDMNSLRRQVIKKDYIATMRPSVLLLQSLLPQGNRWGIYPN